MKRFTLAAVALSAILAGASAATAHHSVNGVYDAAKSEQITGTITEVDWVNPHIHFVLIAKGKADQQETWRFECVPVAVARRAGLSKDLLMASGKPVEIHFNPSRVGDRTGYANQLVLPDGRKLVFNGERT